MRILRIQSKASQKITITKMKTETFESDKKYYQNFFN